MHHIVLIFVATYSATILVEIAKTPKIGGKVDVCAYHKEIFFLKFDRDTLRLGT